MSARGKHGASFTPRCKKCESARRWRRDNDRRPKAGMGLDRLEVTAIIQHGSMNHHASDSRRFKVRVLCKDCGHKFNSVHPDLVRRAEYIAHLIPDHSK